MIFSKTPYRISFLGGGTDYPKWYLKNGGQVISTSIDKYLYITCRYLPPFHEHKIRLVYSKIEKVKNYKDLIHPSAKAVTQYLKIKDGLEIHYDGDLPARSGIGSSSAFTVGLLSALKAYQGKIISKKKLYEESIKIEQNIIKETVGSQDQISTANGDFNHIKFKKNGKIIVNKINISSEIVNKLDKNILLFFTGTVRTAEDIAKTVITDISKKNKYFNNLYTIVDEGIKFLKEGNIDDFGRLLDKNWQQKKFLSNKISNKKIDYLYNTALKAGALGGKITGAGAGGFMIFYVPLKFQKNVIGTFKKKIF